MSWSSWSAKLNVQSIVSQGLEQVSKLKEDVEKQFDQVVTVSSAQPPGSSSRGSASAAAASAAAPSHGVEPPSPAVSAALFGDASANAVVPPPPPRSLDSTSSAALLASLGLKKAENGASKTLPTDAPASAPTSRTGSKGSAASVADFFGSYLPEDVTTDGATTSGPTGEEVGLVSTKNDVSKTAIVPTDAVPPDGPTEAQDDAIESSESVTKCPVGDDEDTQGGAAEDTVLTRAARDVVENTTEPAEREESHEDHDNDNDKDPNEGVSVSQYAFDVTHENAIHEAQPRAEDETNTDDEHGSFQSPNAQPSSTEEEHDEGSQFVTSQSLTNDASTDADGEVRSLKQQLAQRETQLMSTSAVIQELHDELDKTCQREVAAVEKNRFLNEQLELLRHEVLRLNRIVAQQQETSSRDQELIALQQAVAEKDDKLQALLDEGQALSVKQSQLEQRLRQLRREKNEEEELKLKLQAQNDTLAIQLHDITAKHKDVEDERKSLQIELKNVQQGLEQTKNELSHSQNELTQQIGRVAQLEANVGSLRDENESMRAELERLQHTSDSHATLSVEKSEMEATIQYLQQTVQGLEAEGYRREEMARVEVADLKRKWKDALQKVEALGQSVSEATQPLLRQIHALQEDQRARQDTWKATEQTLLQRIHDASAQRKAIETDKLAQDERLHELQAIIDDLQHDVRRTEADVLREKERVDTALQKEREAQSKCDALHIELDELKNKLQEEQHAKQALLTRVAMTNAAEASSKRHGEAQVLAETTALVAEMQQLKQREEQLRHDLEWHQKELQRVKAAALSPRVAMLQHRRSFDEDWSGSANGSPRVGAQTNSSQASILQRTLESSVDDSRLSSTSVLGLSQLQQRLRLREGENRLLRQQLQVLEDKQKQTTDEIVRLSTRNALLESSATQFEETQQQLEQLKQKQHVLLELFGEKEEQVEELQSEVKELKAFYRKQLDTLASHQK